MEKLGLQRKRLKEVEALAERFSDAMLSADTTFVAETGRFTPNMTIVWNLYVEWCHTYEKERI